MTQRITTHHQTPSAPVHRTRDSRAGRTSDTSPFGAGSGKLCLFRFVVLVLVISCLNCFCLLLLLLLSLLLVLLLAQGSSPTGPGPSRPLACPPKRKSAAAARRQGPPGPGRRGRARPVLPSPQALFAFSFFGETTRRDDTIVQNQMFAQASRGHRTDPSAQPGGTTYHLITAGFPGGVPESGSPSRSELYSRPVSLLRVSLLRVSLPRFVDSNLAGNSLWTLEFRRLR